MKKLLLMFALLASGITLSAQKQIVWFDAGIRFQGGGSGILNQTIIDQPDTDYEISYTNSYGIGGRLGINKSYSGLSLEAMFNSFEQTFETMDGVEEATVNWKSIDFYPLFRNAKNLGYFEIGPKISFLREFSNNEGNDIKENFSSTNIGAAVGFGAYVAGTDGAFSATLGLRFEYGFTNYISGDAPEGYTPLGDSFSDDNGNVIEGSSANPFFAGLVFELNWGIGYFGVAQCGGRSKFMMF